MDNSSTTIKLKKLIQKDIENKKNIRILEFGVNFGDSTKFFLDICEKNNGNLISVDTEDCRSEINSIRWKFIKSRDDNFEKIEQIIDNEKFDVIFLDTEHTPKHIEKILYYYYKFLKINGFFLIDDICWLPYLKDNYRNNEWIEVNNKKSFELLMMILNQNLKNIELDLCMDHSGMAKIKKKTEELNYPIKLNERDKNLKQQIKRILNSF